jgi:predicted membrane protein
MGGLSLPEFIMFQFAHLALALTLTPLARSVAQTAGSPMAAASLLHAGRARGPLWVQGLAFVEDTVRPHIRPSHWLEGALVGAGTLGVLTAYLGHGLCTNSDVRQPSCLEELVVGGVIGGLTGFGLGALIGGQFPKRVQVDSVAAGP